MSDIVIISGFICLTAIIITFLISAFKAYAEIEAAKANPMNKLFGASDGRER